MGFSRAWKGRLAQLVEHLAYTERVGGSRPSPPTIPVWVRALALALSAWLFAAPGLARAEPMRFRLIDLDSGRCGARCPQAIAADGVIEAETPEAFVAFAKQAAQSPGLRSVVFLSSPGGNVVASMELGAVFRKLHVAAIVARFDSGAPEAGPFAGQCISACVYAMMGAVRRIAPPGSRVGLHRMSIVEHGFFSTTRTLADPELVAALSRYAARMGVGRGLVTLAESLDPEIVHLLTRGEMARWRLATAQFY